MSIQKAVYLSEIDGFTYEGDVLDSRWPHGKGIFYYDNGDIYEGEVKYGKPDGYGKKKIMTNNGFVYYTGFFILGKQNGIGTLETDKNICKGNWRTNMKYGKFIKTNKEKKRTYEELWIKGKLIKTTPRQYIREELLKTSDINPKYEKTKEVKVYKGKEKKCIGCYENSTNSTNTKCGHVVMCYDCLIKCDKCPICRCEMGPILKLYLS